jgi:hypothetical protein
VEQYRKFWTQKAGCPRNLSRRVAKKPGEKTRKSKKPCFKKKKINDNLIYHFKKSDYGN